MIEIQETNVNFTNKPLSQKGLAFFDEELKKKYLKKYIIGVDEAGRGPLAGPVVACASFISDSSYDFFEEVNDSKKLSPQKREILFKKMISSNVVRFGFAYSDNIEVDKINILNATLLAMKKSVMRLVSYLSIDMDDLLVIVDGNQKIKDFNCFQIPIVKGDLKSLSIASASIFAKVLRDRWMDIIDLNNSVYDFKTHKGYPTKKHIELIKKHGLSVYHRKSYAPCKGL